jgi:uncharacterized protein DUF6084
MAELTFGCTGAHMVRNAATPTFALSLNITESTGVRLHAIALRCQIRIEPRRREYSADEARRLTDLFGETDRWTRAAEFLQLATLSAIVAGFRWRTEVDLQVPCSYDLEVASARYLQALDDGIIPLLLLFSGTVFVDHGNTYSVELIPWSLEASFPLPVRVWHDVIDEHFPGSAWLRCNRDTLGALAEFKSANALPTWDATLSALLAAASMPCGPGAEPSPASAEQEPEAAAPEPAAQEQEAAVPELEVAVPELEGAVPELEVAVPGRRDGAPEEAPTEEAQPEEAQPEEAQPEEAQPEEAQPEETVPAKRRTGTGRRRTRPAGRTR